MLSDSGWGLSLKSLISWQAGNHVRFGGITYDRNAVVALALAPDKRHVFGVTISNQLKSWNLETGKVGFIADIVSGDDIKDRSSHILDPTHHHNLTVIDAKYRSGDQYYIATYSPLAGGQFKFWAVIDPDTAERGLLDLYSDKVLEAPPPAGSDMWRVDRFQIAQAASSDKRKLAIYVLWKNLSNYAVKTLQFDLLKLREGWTDWTVVAQEALTAPKLPSMDSETAVSFPQSCLDFVFFPGRYSPALLETALSVYLSNPKHRADDLPAQNAPLRARVASALSGKVTLQSKSADQPDFALFRNSIQSQWLNFYRIIVELDKSRAEALSLDVDPYSGRAWIALADGLSLIRDCSSSELIYHNQNPMADFEDDPLEWDLRKVARFYNRPQFESLSATLHAATAFVAAFPEPLLAACKAALRTELVQPPAISASNRLRQFYDRCNFAHLLESEDYNTLVEKVDASGVADLLNLETLSLLGQTPDSNEFDLRQTSFTTALMRRFLMRGCQEQGQVNWESLFNLLILTVFLEVEIDREDEAAANFDGNGLYNWLLVKLKKEAILVWLSTSVRSAGPGSDSDALESGLERLDVSAQPSAGSKKPGTLFQELYIGYLNLPLEAARADTSSKARHSGTSLLTYCIQLALDGVGSSPVQLTDTELPMIACHLVRTSNSALALELVRYLPSTPWATYVKARIFFAEGQTRQATALFRKAAVGLAHRASASVTGKERGATAGTSDGLITPNDQNRFFAGYPAYYAHVIELLESQAAYSYVSDFAKIALQFAGTGAGDERVSRINTVSTAS